MKIFDITRPLFRDMVVYPGDVVPTYVQKDAGNYLISELRLGSHAGTHIDAPVHYLKEGTTIDTVPLGNLIGKCRVLDMSGAGTRITGHHIEAGIAGAERVLLKTSFSGASSFIEDYPCLDSTAARLISGAGIRCVGIDSPSIEAFNCDGSVHRELLGSGCSIIELLDLSGVDEGEYDLVALPLRLAGLDGSPARVVLLKN